VENQEWEECLFLEEGGYAIGFELNKEKKFALKCEKSYRIGLFNCSFDKRSGYLYKAIKVSKGYGIRKCRWKSLLANHSTLAT